MEGKQIRFIATSDEIPTTTDLKVNGRSGIYAFQGNFYGSSASGTAYKLVSQEGGRDYFEETTDTILPFHAQIISTKDAVSHAKRLSIYAEGETTGIVGVMDKTSQQPSTYFTIDGVDTGFTDVKLLKKGIYIHGNSKSEGHYNLMFCFFKYSVGVIPSTRRNVLKKLDFLKPHFSLSAVSVYLLYSPSAISRLNSSKR